MNSIDLQVRDSTNGPAVHVTIDGRDLVDLLRRIELPAATADGHPEIAGSYRGLSPYEWEALPELEDDGRVAVLGCECGEVGCWPFQVRISWRPATVLWSDFHGPGRNCDYTALGRFIFAR
ncbi:MAG TPA: hypothetical protein VGB66_19635, partial [Longimicrobium sp.]